MRELRSAYPAISTSRIAPFFMILFQGRGRSTRSKALLSRSRKRGTPLAFSQHQNQTDPPFRSTQADSAVADLQTNGVARTTVPDQRPTPVTRTSGTSQHSDLDLSRSHTYHSSRYLGGTTELEPLLLDFLSLDEDDEGMVATARVRRLDNNGTFMVLSDDIPGLASANQMALSEIEHLTGPHSSSLIDLYFRHVHPSFPILNETLFRQSLSSRKHLSPLLLNSILLVASTWWHPDPSSLSPRPAFDKLELLAHDILRASLETPSLDTIQAGLLLSHRPSILTPNLTSQLVSAAFDLGLHQDCSAWNIPPWDRSLRKRVAWALYMQDKWSALAHGRPSQISSANWTVPALTAEDFEAPSSPEIKTEYGEENTTGLLFRHLIILTSILSDVLSTFYTLQAQDEIRSAGPNSTALILERAKPIQLKLKNWYTHLPTSLKMDSSLNTEANYPPFSTSSSSSPPPPTTSTTTNNSSPPPSSAANGHLHLAYFATEITLHRPIIRSLSPSSSSSSKSSQQHTPPPPPQPHYLTHICRSAAKTRLISALDFVNRLRPHHLQSFWLFPSRTNFALIASFGCLLQATAPAREEAEFYSSRLEEYRWTLCVSRKDAEFLGSVVEVVDVVGGLVGGVPEKPAVAELAPLPGPPNEMSSFSRQGDGMTREGGGGGGGMREMYERTPSVNASGLASPASSSAGDEMGRDT